MQKRSIKREKERMSALYRMLILSDNENEKNVAGESLKRLENRLGITIHGDPYSPKFKSYKQKR